MIRFLQRYWDLLSALLIIALMISLLLFPNATRLISIQILILGFCVAIIFSARKHWKSYQQAECTREKMIRNALLDLLGLLLTMGAAMYVGRLAGGYIGLRAGFWIGLLAGFLGGFVAAWVVRSIWGRLVALP